ncbi:MAG: hypothetical protein AMXMBFR44_4660 [Candidatus Campbellbacteria bacterium]
MFTLVAVLSFSPLTSLRAQAADAVLTEAQKVAQLEQLIESLIALLEQLYPQIDWSAFGTSDDEDEDEDEDDEDEDEDDPELSVGDPEAEGSDGNEARVSYTIPFSVRAFGEDMYVPVGTTRADTASTAVGVTYVIEDDTGTTYAGGTALSSFDGDGETGDTNDYYKLRKDKSRLFTLKVSFNNEGGTIGYYRARIVGITFDEDTSAGGEYALTAGLRDYRTPSIYVGDTE